MSEAPRASEATVRVWDPVVRVGHWLLVASVALAWFTHEGGGGWHEWIGYAALAIAVLRVGWGFVGPRHARFGSFVRSPSETMAYAKSVTGHREPRHLGHNPLGGWMIVALLAMVIAVGASGWLYTTDRFWGVEWVEELHEALAEALLLLVALHVGGVVFSSHRHRENLAGAMIHGRKRAPGPRDVD